MSEGLVFDTMSIKWRLQKEGSTRAWIAKQNEKAM